MWVATGQLRADLSKAFSKKSSPQANIPRPAPIKNTPDGVFFIGIDCGLRIASATKSHFKG